MKSTWSFERFIVWMCFFVFFLNLLKGAHWGYAVDFCNWRASTCFGMKTCHMSLCHMIAAGLVQRDVYLESMAKFRCNSGWSIRVDILSFSQPSTVHDQSIACHTSYSLFNLLSTSRTPSLIINHDIHRIHSRRNMHIYIYTILHSPTIPESCIINHVPWEHPG